MICGTQPTVDTHWWIEVAAMSGNEDSGNAGRLRKRRSGQLDDDGAVNGANDGVDTDSREIAPDDIEPGAHSHNRSSGNSARPASAPRPRVKQRRSDELTHSNNATPARSSVDSRAIAVMSGGEVEGGPIVGLPLDDARNSTPSPGRAPSKPRSRRNRGLSLRSSLFTRNVDRKVHSPASIVEMQPVGSSNDGHQSSSTAKKSSQTSVTVSPVTEIGPSLPPYSLPSSRKGIKGTSALPNYQQWAQRRPGRRLPLNRVTEICERIRKYVLHIQEVPPSKAGRQIPLDPSRKTKLIDERTEKPFVDNLIRSSKYNLWNFVPRQLWAQFSKLANFYFLIVSVLQMIPGLSTTGTYTTIIPLLFFVSISMGKEGYDDFRRHALDETENRHETRVMHAYRPVPEYTADDDADQMSAEDNGVEGVIHWAPVKWQSLHVGNVVKLKRNEAAPADLVLLKSSGPNNIAYVETTALDGETNLKTKQPCAELIEAYSDTEEIASGGAHFVVEDPNLDLYSFEGKVTVNGGTAPLTNSQIIYRGSKSITWSRTFFMHAPMSVLGLHETQH